MSKQNITNMTKLKNFLKQVYAFWTRLPNSIVSTVYAVIILSIALCNYFVNRADPPYIFWDENYHVTAAERYIEGYAHFEGHPPLGKLFIAVGESLSHANDGIDKRVLIQDKKIDGNALPANFSFSGMRLMPSLFGALAALPFFGLMYALMQNRLHALLLTSLYVFENAYIVHFRAVHLDSFQMFFGLLALWQFARAWNKPEQLNIGRYALIAALVGLAIMVKVNAAVLLLTLPMLYLREHFARSDRSVKQHINAFLQRAGISILAVSIAVAAVFYAHIATTRTPPLVNTPAGDLDISNMSADYRAFLNSNDAITPTVLFVVIRDYWKFMNKDHHGAPRLKPNNPDENGSHPLLWPLHHKTINYRWDSSNGQTAYVQLVGNQLSWYLALAAMVLSLCVIINHRVFGAVLRGSPSTYYRLEIFSGLYICCMLLNLWFINQRVMYLYHYFIALALSFAILALFLRYVSEIHGWTQRKFTSILTGGAVAVLLTYLFFLPLTNHWPLSKDYCEMRNVFSRIVECVG